MNSGVNRTQQGNFSSTTKTAFFLERTALRLSYYWRFLETYDEYFPYSENSPPPQGMWRIYGIGLPDNVLKKIYFQNALRIVPSLKQIYKIPDR